MVMCPTLDSQADNVKAVLQACLWGFVSLESSPEKGAGGAAVEHGSGWGCYGAI